MDEMIAADGHPVAIAADADDVHLRFRHLDAGSERDAPAVGRMQGTEVKISGKP